MGADSAVDAIITSEIFKNYLEDVQDLCKRRNINNIKLNNMTLPAVPAQQTIITDQIVEALMEPLTYLTYFPGELDNTTYKTTVSESGKLNLNDL